MREEKRMNKMEMRREKTEKTRESGGRREGRKNVRKRREGGRKAARKRKLTEVK